MPIPTRLLAATLVGGLTLGLAAPAIAETETETSDPAKRCIEQIDRRLDSLASAQSRAAGVDAVTDSHLATIDAIIDSTEAGLDALIPEIEAAEDRETLAALCRSIATDFRVYLVVLPQTHLTVGADRVEAAVDRGEELVATFDAAVDAAIDAGADVTDAVALRDAAAAHLEAAEAAVAGVGDEVLTVTPAAWNEGGGQTIIEQSRAAVHSGHAEIKDGIADGTAAIEALRAAIGDLG
ncbi:MAG: hypothetical protein AAF081_14820 [Actinomycetota bacterium]